MNPLKRFFQEDLPAVFASGKWQIHMAQLKMKHKQQVSKIGSALAGLGGKAWAGKVHHESYHAVFQSLEDFAAQVEKSQL